MARIIYNGSARGAVVLAEDLGKAGFEALIDERVMERRSGGVAEGVQVVYFIADHAVGGAVSAAGGMAFKAAVDKFKAKYPRSNVEVKDDD